MTRFILFQMSSDFFSKYNVQTEAGQFGFAGIRNYFTNAFYESIFEVSPEKITITGTIKHIIQY